MIEKFEYVTKYIFRERSVTDWSLGEDLEKIFMKDSLAQEEEDKPKDNANSEVQDVEEEPTQPLPKD